MGGHDIFKYIIAIHFLKVGIHKNDVGKICFFAVVEAFQKVNCLVAISGNTNLSY